MLIFPMGGLLHCNTKPVIQCKIKTSCISCYVCAFISSIFNDITFVLNHLAIYVETVHSTSMWNGECLANAILPNKELLIVVEHIIKFVC